ncbi:Low choriolytic enzyme [Liparis tanakae]|uniref:Metalloendopeptidase n=1 Tax=Liparis tanakae TaxID=230148 RepID=A0A4Z2GGD8_9TELE|nr:Low choriolytic enzyme [Liparis tanakae]
MVGLEPTRSSMSWSEYLTSAQEEDTSSRLTRDQENTNMAVTDLQQPEKRGDAELVILNEDVAEEDSAELSVSELLERANRNLIRSADDPILIGGDIAIDSEAERNADPCTSRGCKWGKFTSREKAIITRGLESFSSFSCIRFRPTRSSDRDWLSIESQNGCYSFVGRRGGKQVVSLARSGCLYHGTVQHELLHALGFNHEQTRSDRDNHIRVMLQNVQSGMEHNFRKIATLNQGTPYDYGSVMQYHKYAFSKNNQPTMVPIPNSNVNFGNAKEMSRNDIARLNNLYGCCECPHEHTDTLQAPHNVHLSLSELIHLFAVPRCRRSPLRCPDRTHRGKMSSWGSVNSRGCRPELITSTDTQRGDGLLVLCEQQLQT